MSAPDGTPRSFWVGVGLGVPLMAWGARLYLEATPDLERRVDLGAWVVGLDLAHDLMLAPVILAVGYLVSRFVPRRARASVQVALILSGSVLLVGLLPLLGTADGGNPTIQPIDYGPPVAAVIALIWGATAALQWARARSRRPAGQDGAQAPLRR